MCIAGCENRDLARAMFLIAVRGLCVDSVVSCASPLNRCLYRSRTETTPEASNGRNSSGCWLRLHETMWKVPCRQASVVGIPCSRSLVQPALRRCFTSWTLTKTDQLTEKSCMGVYYAS